MDPSIFDIQAEFCKAMGNAGRLQILHTLREHPKSVNEISQDTRLPQSSVSRHLACLRRVGVVISERQAGEQVYRITDKKIVEVCDLVRSVLTEQITSRLRSIE
jgi:DNA-binding transcriptional ArsR family regulator